MFDLNELIEKLKNKAKDIEYELKVELPKVIREAVAQGDLSENAEYESAKNRQSVLMGRLGQINSRIDELSSAGLSSIPKDKVGFGSTVFVTNLDTGEQREYVLVPPEALDDNPNYISVMSPVARGLLGAYPGDEVVITIPKGEFEFRIDKVITCFGQVLE
jgi:transcription elongation factor GreA